MRQPNNNKFDWVLKFIDFISHLDGSREAKFGRFSQSIETIQQM